MPLAVAAIAVVEALSEEGEENVRRGFHVAAKKSRRVAEGRKVELGGADGGERRVILFAVNAYRINSNCISALSPASNYFIVGV